jgi:phosphoglycolate phosphatase-like HAD superfamily hydrolase
MSTYKWDAISKGYIGLDDITHSKPDPEMIKKSIAKLDLSPSECVTIGDSIYDIEAGNRAGTKTIAVCTGNNTPITFAPFNPTLILSQVGDLEPLIPLKL